MVCAGNGTWNITQPVCEIVKCPQPVTPINGSHAPERTLYSYTDTVQYTCPIEFNLRGVWNNTCNATGQWSNEAPVCVIKDCGNLTAPVNGTVDMTGTTVYSVARYNCTVGYRMIGYNERTCTTSEHWTLESPHCELIGKTYTFIY